jgi:hypothetical protein
VHAVTVPAPVRPQGPAPTVDELRQLRLNASNDIKRKGSRMRLRALATAVLGLLAVPLAVRLGAGPARRLVSDERSWSGRSLDDLLAGVLGAALVVVAALWCLDVLLTLVEVLASPRLAARVRDVPRPRLARAVVLGLVGASVVTGPASGATTAPVPADDPLAGLPLPDRAATVTSDQAPAQAVAPAARLVARPPTRTVTVRPGDTLWSIAADALGSDATTAEIDATWRVVAAANHGAVHDPDLIFPGTELALPPLPHRKEHS